MREKKKKKVHLRGEKENFLCQTASIPRSLGKGASGKKGMERSSEKRFFCRSEVPSGLSTLKKLRHLGRGGHSSGFSVNGFGGG